MKLRSLAAVLALLALVAVTPSPRPSSTYRSIKFEAPEHHRPQGQIEILGGWAAIKRDLKEAIVCLSFRNDAAVTATRVVFELPVVGGSGGTLKELELDRHGVFAQGVEIKGWASLGAWRNGVGEPGESANCKILKGSVPAFSMLSAHYVTYRVKRIEYANGHVLTP